MAAVLKLFDFQNAVVSSKCQDLAFVGGLGCGKTEAIGVFVAQAVAQYRENFICIGASTVPQLRKSTIRKVLATLDKIGIKYRYREMGYKGQPDRSIWFPDSNGTAYFQSTNVPVKELDGPELGELVIDEADGCPQEAVYRMKARVRKRDAGRRVRIFGNAPPEEHWIYRDYWLNPSPEVRLVTATSYDNKYLTQDYIKLLERMYPPGSTLHRRMVMAEFGVPLEGAVYPEFASSTHCIDARELPMSRIIGYIHGLDFGYHNPTAFLTCALDNDDTLYVVDEHYASRMTVAEHAEVIKRKRIGNEPIYSDHDAQLREEYSRLGIDTFPAHKEVLPGIDCVRQRLREGRLKFVRGACPQLLKELPQYHWKKGAKDEPEKLDDHACFGADTLVRMGDGSTRRIADIHAGDSVMTPCGPQFCEGAGITRLQARMLCVTIGGHKMEVTDDHRFLCARPDSSQPDKADIPRRELLPVRELLFTGKAGRWQGVPASGSVDSGKRGSAQGLPRSPYRQRPAEQLTFQPSNAGRARALQEPHDAGATEAVITERAPHDCGSTGMAQVEGRQRVAQEARRRDVESQALQDIQMRGVWRTIREQIDTEAKAPFLRAELQNGKLQGTTPRLSEEVLQAQVIREVTADAYCIAVPCGSFILASGFVVHNCDALRYLVMALDHRQVNALYSLAGVL